MFGLFGGKNKFAEKVSEEILNIINIVKIPETNDTVKTIQKEMKENGAPKELIESVKFNTIVAGALSQPLEHDLDYMYKNFHERQAAMYCISTYITNIYSSGQLAEYKNEQPDMYSALRTLWQTCATAVEQNLDEYGKCIITPGENPFPD